MTQPPILFHSEGAVAHITLNRPDRRNAIGGGMGEALDTALASLRTDRSMRVLVLAGTGGHFCAGLDLTEVAGGGSPEDRLAAQQARNRAVGARFEAISQLPQVVVAAIAQLDAWVERIQTQGVPHFDAFIRTLQRHKKQIANYVEENLSNAVTEGLNNLVRSIRRCAFGMPNFQHLRLRVMAISG